MPKLICRIKELAFSLLWIGFSLFFLVFEVSDTIHTAKLAKNGTPTIAIIQKVTTQHVRSGRSGKEIYSVEVSFEQNGETFIKKFSGTMAFTDKIGGYFETKYRVGNKITILVGEDGSILHYSDRKAILFENASSIFLILLLLGIGIFIFRYQIDSLSSKNNGKPFYFQKKDFKIKKRALHSVNTAEYLKKIENGELICFGFTIGEGFCEYSYEKNVYYERINDTKEEVVNEITDRTVVEQRISEISKIAKKYT